MQLVEIYKQSVRQHVPDARLVTSGGYMYWVEDGSGRIIGAKKTTPERAWRASFRFVELGGVAPQQVPSAIDALQAIANLPTGSNMDIMQGHEDAYRAVEDLFEYPPTITSSK